MNTITADAVLFAPENPLVFARAGQLDYVTVHYETYGTLNEDKSNAVFICHALTGDAHSGGAGDPRTKTKPGWWHIMIGPGKPVDTDRFFVISPNLLGGCRGTTGPSSINPNTGQSYGLDFPLLDMCDLVTVHQRLMAHLGIERLLAVMGGSLGGMQVLQWALTAPTEMANAIIIAASSRLTTQNIAFSAVAREAIMRDPGFKDGRYIEAGTKPTEGLSVARMMAHLTYMSEDRLGDRFGRNPQNADFTPGFEADFAIESYLRHQAKVFLPRFDALSYLYLTRVMDYFDPFADPDATKLIADNPMPTLVCSFASDWRFSSEQSKVVVAELANAHVEVTYREFQAGVGHDSFLMETRGYTKLVQTFLNRALAEVNK
jgi:homoserine O-acetyltransferase